MSMSQEVFKDLGAILLQRMVENFNRVITLSDVDDKLS
jgi:hypothetical protein